MIRRLLLSAVVSVVITIAAFTATTVIWLWYSRPDGTGYPSAGAGVLVVLIPIQLMIALVVAPLVLVLTYRWLVKRGF